MQVYDIIVSAQSGRALASLAATAGIDERAAESVLKAALPEMALALERNTLSRGGLADVVRALGQGHHEAILEHPESWRDPRVVADGEAILAHILGSEGRTRALAARTARAAGLGEGVVRMLLPILAQLLMGALARYTKGGLGDILSRLPIPGGGNAGRRPGPADRSREFETGGRMGEGTGFELPRADLPPGNYPMPPIPGSAEPGRSGDREPDGRGQGGSGLPWPWREDRQAGEGRPERQGRGFDLPTTNGPPPGGYPMPPIPEWPGPAGPESGRSREDGGFPLPGPRGDNPYGDLSDILRRGGRMPAPAGETFGAGGLWSIVRQVLGGALGFGKRGIVGWIIQFIVVRWGWKLLQRILLGR